MLRADLTGEVEAVAVSRHDDVGEDEVHGPLPFRQDRGGGGHVAGVDHGIADLLQVSAGDLGHVRVVLDEEHVAPGFRALQDLALRRGGAFGRSRVRGR
jgi:hypothetical protein